MRFGFFQILFRGLRHMNCNSSQKYYRLQLDFLMPIRIHDVLKVIQIYLRFSPHFSLKINELIHFFSNRSLFFSTQLLVKLLLFEFSNQF